MREAIALAADPDFRGGGNPRVGCVILDASGAIIGRGHHRGAGHPHAEVVALSQAGDRAKGSTAVVTLEPCRHTGRTPPCTDALIAAGVSQVVFAIADPGEHSGGGGALLRESGIAVQGGVDADRAAPLIREWLHAQRTGRPWVIAKCAMSLDGRVADRDGSPLRLTGAMVDARNHELRAQVDAIVVGTGTVLSDDPHLTARPTPDYAGPQPLRIAVGKRPVPTSSRIRGVSFRQITETDPPRVLAELHEDGCVVVLLEGGPTLTRAWLHAGVVDEIRWTVSPVVIGSGPTALGGHMQTVPVQIEAVQVVGEDVLIQGTLPAARE